MSTIRRVEAWRRGTDIAVAIYALTKSFPREELFGLTSQLRSAPVSVPSNISEGVERDTAPARRRFLGNARGSLAEVETQLEISARIELIDEPTLLATLELTDHLGACSPTCGETSATALAPSTPLAHAHRPSPIASRICIQFLASQRFVSHGNGGPRLFQAALPQLMALYHGTEPDPPTVRGEHE